MDDEVVEVAAGEEDLQGILVDHPFLSWGTYVYHVPRFTRACQAVVWSFPLSVAQQLNSSCHLLFPARLARIESMYEPRDFLSAFLIL